MKITYHEDTDSLYLRLNNEEPYNAHEITDDWIVHLDSRGNICLMEWTKDASKQVHLSRVEVEGLPEGPGRVGSGWEAAGRRAEGVVAQEAREKGGIRISYDEASDSLRVSVNNKKVEESLDIAGGTWLHTDYCINLCAIEWSENASQQVDLSRLDLEGMPIEPGRSGPAKEEA